MTMKREDQEPKRQPEGKAEERERPEDVFFDTKQLNELFSGTRESSQPQLKPPSGKPNAAGSQKKKAPPRKKWPLWVRIVYQTLRIVIVPVLAIAALLAGLAIGYVYLGGQPMDEVWRVETWKHVYDLVFSPS